MPRHKQVMTCLRGDGPISKFCSCAHCTLCVCSVCGAYEGGLTTDCPGVKVDFDHQQEVYETKLDYTDERGWHQGESMKLRSPRFEETKLPPTPPRVDPRVVVEPSINWAAVDHMTNLQHELSQRAIAWVLADRICEDRTATLARVEDETEKLRGKEQLDEGDRDLLAKLEHEKIGFQLACRRVEACDDEFRQAARKLVTALEGACVRPAADPAKKDDHKP